jgi:NTP pyrophosphatase (non-canonical NTP hydrolase)
MDANEYQKLAARTLTSKPGAPLSDADAMLIWNALGLTGEAGEVADLIKKGVFHQHGVDKQKLLKELGDVMWYIAAMCTGMGATMSDVMAMNIEKLKTRYPDGFKTTDSLARIDVHS